MENFIDKKLSTKLEKYFEFLNKMMVDEQIKKRGIKDERLLSAFSKIQRHKFLPEALWSRAYDDYAIEIYPNQTISQPYINAFMVEKLKLSGKEKVLEIGTGSGYQTAILCLLAREVYSLDIKENLMASAEKNLKNLGLSNFHLFTADGKRGLLGNSPYDRIIISCAMRDINEEILSQLSTGGLLIAPIGNEESQEICLVQKTSGEFRIEKYIKVRFVQMI